MGNTSSALSKAKPIRDAASSSSRSSSSSSSSSALARIQAECKEDRALMGRNILEKAGLLTAENTALLAQFSENAIKIAKGLIVLNRYGLLTEENSLLLAQNGQHVDDITEMLVRFNRTVANQKDFVFLVHAPKNVFSMARALKALHEQNIEADEYRIFLTLTVPETADYLAMAIWHLKIQSFTIENCALLVSQMKDALTALYIENMLLSLVRHGLASQENFLQLIKLNVEDRAHHGLDSTFNFLLNKGICTQTNFDPNYNLSDL